MSFLDTVKRVLEGFEWSRYGVGYAVVFGSATQGSSKPRDVDIAISCLDRRCDSDTVLELYASLSKLLEPSLGLSLDLVVLDWNPPCELVLEIYRNGVLIYEAFPGIYLEDMVRRVLICYDWSLVEKKLRVLETAEEVVLSGYSH